MFCFSAQWKPKWFRTTQHTTDFHYMETNKQTLFFIWVNCPLNDSREFGQRLHIITSSGRKTVFVYNTIIKTGRSSPDCHYCLGEGLEQGGLELVIGGCECNLNEADREQKWGIGGGGDYWPPESETKSHRHRKQHSNLSASSLARCLGLTEHMSRAQLKSRAERYKELHLTQRKTAFVLNKTKVTTQNILVLVALVADAVLTSKWVGLYINSLYLHSQTTGLSFFSPRTFFFYILHHFYSRHTSIFFKPKILPSGLHYPKISCGNKQQANWLMLHVIFSPVCVSESDWMGQAEITLHLINDSTAEEKGVTTSVTLLHREKN